MTAGKFPAVLFLGGGRNYAGGVAAGVLRAPFEGFSPTPGAKSLSLGDRRRMFEERTVCATSSSPAEGAGLFPRSPVLERAENPTPHRLGFSRSGVGGAELEDQGGVEGGGYFGEGFDGQVLVGALYAGDDGLGRADGFG